MSEWPLTRLDELYEVRGRIGWKGYKTSDLRESGPLVIGGKEVKSEIQLNLSNVKHLTREKFDESPEIILAHHDLLVVCRGNLADVGLFDISLGEATLNPSVVLLRTRSSGCLPKFAFYFFSSRIGRNELLSIASGSSVPAIYQSELKKVSLPNPPLLTQKAIAEVLSSLDDKIDLLKRQNKTLEGMAKALFRQWFIEEAQDDWEEVELKDIAENARNTMKPENINQNVKLVGLEHFDSKSLVLSRYENTEELGSQKYKFAQGQILFGKLRPYFHNIALPFFDGVCSTDILVIEAKRSTWRLFVFFFLNQDWVVEAATQSASGTRMPRTNWKFLGSLPIHFPDAKLLSEFNSIVEPIVTKMSKNWSEITLLQNQRDTILPKLMSGEVRVQMD